MWNWLVVGLFSGCSLVLYDGSPLLPTPNILWDLVDKLGELSYAICTVMLKVGYRLNSINSQASQPSCFVQVFDEDEATYVLV